MKKILAIVITLSMVFSVPVFADTNPPAQTTATEETTTAQPTTEAQTASDTSTTAQAEATTTTIVTTTVEPGITPDSVLYSLDKLMEKIQLALVTDAVVEAEVLAKIAQERLAESNAMVDKNDVELTQKALEEYKDNLEQAVELIETAMENGKQVASVMDAINDANLKDAAAIEKILASIPEEFRDEVKTGIEDLAAVTEAATETAQVVEGTEDEQNSVKQEITNKIIEEKVQDAALITIINEAGLNTRQVIALISLAEQADKPLSEVVDLFLQNEKGIGATAKELGLTTKDALKGINGSFKDTKETIKNAFKAAIKLEDEDDQEEVEDIVNSSLAGQTEAVQAIATTEEVKAIKAKLEKVVDEAKAQIEALAENKGEKAIGKAEKEIEKTLDKAEREIEKALVKAEKAKDEAAKIDADDSEDEDDKDDVDAEEAEDDDDKAKDSQKEDKGKSNKKN